jgi:error-prone DNA polymerase
MIMGFSGFGFPKAHGAAFGLLAYQSTWLRVHYGPEFLCALLNEQPMGFYASDTLVHEAQRRGIPLYPADVNVSAVTCTTDGEGVRIGLGYVSGVRTDEVAALVAERDAGGPFRSLGELASRAGAGRPALAQLAWAGACDSLRATDRVTRREVLWELGIAAPGEQVPEGTQLSLPLDVPAAPQLRELEPWESMIADYATTGLTLGSHPMALLRGELAAGVVSCRDLETMRHEERVKIGGLVVARQRPGTAKGIVFLLIEDEFGTVNLIVPPPVYERHRLLVRSEPLLIASGRLEKLPIAGGAINVFVDDLEPLKAPQADGAVVSLEERARQDAEAAEMADFRTVAPAVQSFASGRRR